jgi:Cu-Zn family superoxide dismutase
MKAMLIGLVPGAMLIGLAAGCTVGDVPSNEKHATAALEAKKESGVTGTATFTSSGPGVKLTLTVTGASAGQHGVHLHAVGDCSADDASSAMGHWNPSTMDHGLPAASAHHLGDCGNITVGADGTGKLELTNAWTIGTGEMTDVLGKAVIVHAAVDDGTSPTATGTTPGNSGARQACGVIAAQ